MNNNEFKVSVVIPVYNASPFIRKAVESALMQAEVAEVILVEDKSPDDSLLKCQELVKENERVKLYRHPNGENRGAAASRNLGVLKATSEFIAFLDADDYYLANRFSKAKEIMLSEPSVDGVYDAIGLHIYSQNGKERYESYKGKEMDPNKLITITEEIEPKDLFNKMVTKRVGIFHANGITLHRNFLLRVGLFDEDLNIVEDTVLWHKLAYEGLLKGGSLHNPVARQGIHDQNREPDTTKDLLFQKYNRLLTYFVSKPVQKNILRIFFSRMLAYHPNRKYESKNSTLRKLEIFYLACFELVSHPGWVIKLI